jgi:hypothetical protein
VTTSTHAGSRFTSRASRPATPALAPASATSIPRFGLDNYEYRETWTNTANGRSFTIWGNGIIRDVSATPVSGSVFQFTTVESGRPFNISDASGRVLVRDRGAIRRTYLFDTEGDDAPGGIFLDVLEERVSGPHPAFSMSEDEFCAVVTPLLS